MVVHMKEADLVEFALEQHHELRMPEQSGVSSR
jgi:hypothetical protein